MYVPYFEASGRSEGKAPRHGGRPLGCVTICNVFMLEIGYDVSQCVNLDVGFVLEIKEARYGCR